MEASCHCPFFPEILLASSPCGQDRLAAQPGCGAEVEWRGSMCARVPGEERGETGRTGVCGFSHPAVGSLMGWILSGEMFS